MKRCKMLAVLVVLALVAVPCTVALAKKPAPPIVNLHGTTWVVKGNLTINIAKVGKKTFKDQETLFFGENDNEYLYNANQFLLISQMTAMTYRGTWVDPKQNGAAVFDMDAAMLNANMASICAMVCEYENVKFTNVQASVTKSTVKGTLVPGKSGTMTFSQSFKATVTMQGGVKQNYTGTFFRHWHSDAGALSR